MLSGRNFKPQRMKIVFITPYKPLEDGIRYYSENLISGFKKADSVLDLKVIPWNYPSKASRLFKPLLRASEIAAQLRSADIIHVQFVASLYLWNLLFSLISMKLKGGRAKVVLTVHETNDNTRPKWLFDFIQSFYLSLADLIIVHSSYHRELLPKIVQRKTFVVPHGIPSFPLDKNVKRDLRLLLLPGFINRWKGYDVAIRALSLLRKKKANLWMVILGRAHDPVYTRGLHLLTKELKLDNFVKFETDFVSNSRFRRAFQEAGLVILPYRRIAMSGILSHAIAYQSPTIMSDLAPFKEYTKNRGVYFRNGDFRNLAFQIEKMLTNTKLQRQQRQLFAQLRKEYSYPNVARQILNLYRKINVA